MKDHFHHYFDRYAENNCFEDLAHEKETGIIIVIPCYNEPGLITSLESLKNCFPTSCTVQVFIVINGSKIDTEEIQKQNQTTFNQGRLAFPDKDWINFHFTLVSDLPKKHAGVGLARKIGMDQAAGYFKKIGKTDGIILCYDADTTCSSEYLTEIEKHFSLNSKQEAASIHFEHPTSGDLEAEIYEAIIRYELHLRYYINYQGFIGFPHAFQTIGSSMAVRASAYVKFGGMNKRKAGEDFYFLHKFIPNGHFGEITSTKTIPSPRVSNRVPFGTGKSVGDQIALHNQGLDTYNPKSFEVLKPFLNAIPSLFNDENTIKPHTGVEDFLASLNFDQELLRIRKQSNDQGQFLNHFYRWFDGFKMMKYVHFMRDHHFPNLPIQEAANMLRLNILGSGSETVSEKELLDWFRLYDIKKAR